jgi:2-methylisocitrate lyase-like PEP mutase family enzyme
VKQQEKARLFHELHARKQILVLINAWDAASARAFELAGAAAIATTSAGVAACFGYPDGQHVGRDLVLGSLARVCASVDLPVSADLEAGYGTTVGEVCETVRGVLDAGAIGINIEDEMADPQVLCEKIAAIRDVARSRGVELFVNARTDVYLRGKGDAAQRFDDAVLRLRAYAAAGADGLFAPGLGNADAIAKLVGQVERPLNILGGAGVPSIPELERLGVKRVSMGSGPMRASLTFASRLAREILHDGTYAGFLGDTLSHAEVNRMFTHRAA